MSRATGRRARNGREWGVSRICVVGGGGYVGLGYAVALADLGHDVVGRRYQYVVADVGV